MMIQLIGLSLILAELKLDNVWLHLQNWWLWLTITGVMLGSAFSVKFVGLFVILLVSVKDFITYYEFKIDVESGN